VVADPHNERTEAVLAAVVRNYVESAHPVASQPIAEDLRLSSATIRNVFADLERLGYLSHPHTSAGRVPTDRGYRMYVDHLMRVRELNLKERQAIEEQYQARRVEVESLLQKTARLLSAMTNLVGVAVAPIPLDFRLDHFQLAAIDTRTVMVILVTGDGMVREEVVRLEKPLESRELQKIHQVLNQRFAGKSLTEIRSGLLKDAEESRRLRLSLVQAALDLIDHTLRLTGDQVIVEGASQLVSQPEFRDAGSMGRVIRLMEERQPLANLLGSQWEVPGLKVEIGREIQEDGLSLFSVVHVPYRLRGRVAGALAVLGPTRMPYEQVTVTLNQVSRLLEEHLAEKTEQP